MLLSLNRIAYKFNSGVESTESLKNLLDILGHASTDTIIDKLEGHISVNQQSNYLKLIAPIFVLKVLARVRTKLVFQKLLYLGNQPTVTKLALLFGHSMLIFTVLFTV